MREYLKKNITAINTPAYYFDLDEFFKRIKYVSTKLEGIPLTYSIKANPFLLHYLPMQICHVEACSPGELEICKNQRIPGNQIIYSGVNKEKWDIKEAMTFGVDIITVESKLQAMLVQEVTDEIGIKQKVLLRLSSGNQFGMSEEDTLAVLSKLEHYPNLDFIGIHYYSGTQKKKKQIQRDMEKLTSFLDLASEELGYQPKLVEMGPGLIVNYFNPPYEEADYQELEEIAIILKRFAGKYPLGVEMGRFLASSCGTFATRVKDIKENDDTNYIICDGGIHHLKYFGQNMAMQIPEMEAISNQYEVKNYCICGSLCTTADVLVREVTLPELTIDDVILFHRCGAYSVTEGMGLFLSRDFPEVYVYQKQSGLTKLRDFIHTSTFNTSFM